MNLKTHPSFFILGGNKGYWGFQCNWHSNTYHWNPKKAIYQCVNEDGSVDTLTEEEISQIKNGDSNTQSYCYYIEYEV